MRLNLGDIRRQQNREADRRGKKTPLGIGRIWNLGVASGAAGAIVDRLLDVGLHFLLCRRIILTILRSILRERIVRGPEKSGQVPARRTYVQPLFGKIRILRSRADEVAAEGRHDRRADIDGSDGRGHFRFDASMITISPSVLESQLDVYAGLNPDAL